MMEMEERYLFERRSWIKTMYIGLITITVLFGGMLFIALKNNDKDLKGPIDLNKIDLSTASNGDFVKMKFDSMKPYIAFYPYTNSASSSAMTKVYIYPYKGKNLFVNVSIGKSPDYEKLVISSQSGQKLADTPIEPIGKLLTIEPELKKLAMELPENNLGTGPIQDEQFNQYFWPLLFDTHLPDRIGQDNTIMIIISFGSCYFIAAGIVFITIFIKFSKLKRKYNQKNENTANI